MALDARDYEAMKRALMQRGYTEQQASVLAYERLKRHSTPGQTTLEFDESLSNRNTREAINNLVNGQSTATPVAADIIGADPGFESSGISGIGPVANAEQYGGALTALQNPGAIGPVASGDTYGGMLRASDSASGASNAAGYASIVGQSLGFLGDVQSGQYSNNELAQDAQKRAGLAVADFYTGGLASVGAGLLLKTPFGKKADSIYNKIDSKVNPMTPILGKTMGFLGIGGDNKYLTEYKRAQELRDKGIEWNLSTQPQQHGLSKEELIDRAMKNNGNVKFAQSRNEADLTPDEVAGYAVFGEKFGNDWFKKFTDDQRRQIAQLALNQGLVREHHGTIDVNFNEDFDAQVQKILSGELKIDAKPSTHPQGPDASGANIDPGRIPSFNINISGGAQAQSNANANATSQAMLNMGLSNDDSINLINKYKDLGALTPNEAAQAAYHVGKLNGSS